MTCDGFRGLDPDLLVWFALRRARRGGVTTLGDRWLDRGYPIPDYLTDTLDQLTRTGLLAATDAQPDADPAGQALAVTDAGHIRYLELRQRDHIGHVDIRVLAGMPEDRAR